MGTNTIKIMFVCITRFALVLFVMLSASTVAAASSASPFVGHWQAIDVDESSIHLVIAEIPSGPYRITWTESYLSACNGGAGIVRGMGWLREGDSNLLEADLQVECFTTKTVIDFHMVWRYQPGSDTLISQYEENGYVIIWRHPGSKSPSPSIPTFVAYVPGAVEGYDWQLGDAVSININYGEYISEAEVDESPWDPAQTRVLFETWKDDFFIEAGDYIVMTDGFVSKDVTVTTLAVTSIDTVADTVSGIYDPNYSIWVWLYDEEGQVPETDPENGSWVATFTELPPGAWGGAVQWEADGDGTSLDFQVPNPHFSVFPEWGYVEGWRWPEDALVTAMVDDKPECYISGNSGHPEWDPNELFVGLWFPDNCDIVVGDVVTVTDGVTPRIYKVQYLSITEVDKEDNSVSGTAYPGGLVYIWVHDYGYDMELLAEDGSWFADFGESGLDLVEGMGGRVEVRDEIGNATAVDWRIPKLDLRVNYGDDWVESFYEGEHKVQITVTDGDDNVKAKAEVSTDSGGYFQTQWSGWLDGDGIPLENPPDIQPMDWVYAVVDDGVAAQVQIGEIKGTIDLENDFVKGTIIASWITESVQVECLDWGSGNDPPLDTVQDGSILTNGSEFYYCSWAAWDIQPGQTIGVAYFNPDGHWVANAFYTED